jgi:hypothetical protein
MAKTSASMRLVLKRIVLNPALVVVEVVATTAVAAVATTPTGVTKAGNFPSGFPARHH